MEKQKKTKLISKILICIGIVVVALGISLVVSSIKDYNKAKSESRLEYQQKLDKYNQDMAEYEEAYDEWHDQWWGGNGDVTLNDQPKRPTHPGFEKIVVPPMTLFLGIFIMIVGIGVIASGFISHIAKPVVNNKKDVFGLVGNMVTNVAPNKNEERKNNFVYCSYCGRKNKATEVECSDCGANLK